MTPEQQRIEIAKACGFRWCWFSDVVTTIHLFRKPQQQVNHGPKRWMVAPGKSPGPLGIENATMDMALDDDPLLDVPEYLSDLNAMHEAEKVLSLAQFWVYACTLKAMPPHGSLGADGYITATAAQRAEAFLRTLNLWTEDQQ